MFILEADIWQQFIQQLQQTSWLEWLGFVSTIACIYLAAKENILNWPISIISIVISAVLYFQSHLFGDFALQFYFLFTAFYGWWFWIKKKKEVAKPIVSIKAIHWLTIMAAVLVFTGVLGYLLDQYTPTNVPYEDGFCTAVSLVAQIMLTRKILENWILWIIVDICYVPLLIYKNLNVYAMLYTILVIIALKGHLDWKKTYREQAHY
ncbi:nicotinamide riboside transporter PnuC [Pedobacter sp. SL55]|uniref:nicotinamide riboside transporter PnuC n=1 Tax=Pedobacter sp. SL55 TaxID=2995161 RepID=UPI00226F2724|nr:nicotinamide riboside transporter PnuC [Pedobacter sp. SL55]WAC42123.1 nicotinamide riboside transporter PnuC [Pedobacter sp. SL55]